MVYEIYKVKDNLELVKNVTSINWSDSINLPFVSFSFKTTEEIAIGTKVKLCAKTQDKTAEKTVFSGVITKVLIKDEKFIYSGFDYKNCSNNFYSLDLVDNYFKDSYSIENKDKSTSSLVVLGDYKIKKGVIFPHKSEGFDMTYLIKSSTHKIDSFYEFVKVDVIPFFKKQSTTTPILT